MSTAVAPMNARRLSLTDTTIIVVGLILLTTISWSYLLYDAHEMTRGRSCCAALASIRLRTWTPGDLSVLAVMWIVMMVAMMTPAAAPMVLLFAMVQRKRRSESRAAVSTGFFLAGYLVIWTAFSLVATGAQAAMHCGALLSPHMTSASPWLGGGLLLAAGLFQFTPWKHACLRHCRSPLTLLLADWREGPRGAWTMGLRHGISCTGCCWLLMALLFVLGVMNLMWVAAITAFVLLEKIAPKPRVVSAIAGVACIAWGVIVLGRFV